MSIVTIKSMVLAVVAVTACALPGIALEIGDKIPASDVKLKGIDGKALAIGDVAGEKGTLVVFSCVHCPVVKAAQERMVVLANKYSKKDVGVVFINSNDPVKYPSDGIDGMRSQAKKHGYEFPYVADDTSNVARAFGAKRTPEMFLFDADGKLVYHGTIDDSPNNPKAVEKQYLRDALKAVISGEDVPEKKTRAVGCGIKFRKAK